MSDLPGVLGDVAPYVHDYGLAAVAGFLLLKNAGVPVPGEAILVTAVVIGTHGDISIPAVVAVAVVAAFVGEAIGYAIGYYGGRPLAVRYGRRIGITHARLDRLEEFFDHRGAWVIVFGRFLPLLRHWAGLSAGISKMSLRLFLIAEGVGALLWVAVWATLAAVAGNNLDPVVKLISRGGPVLLVVVLLAVAVLVVVRRRRRAAVAVESVESAEPVE